MHELKDIADKAKSLYNRGIIDRELAKRIITPYIEAYNEKAIEIGKKHNKRPKTINIISYLR